eukprot:496326_1
MKRSKPHCFWYRSTVVKMNIWIFLMYILMLSILDNFEPGHQHCSSSQLDHIAQSDFGSAVFYHHIVKLHSLNATFFGLKLDIFEKICQVYYTCEYLKARKAHRILKPSHFYKIFEFSDQLRTLMIWNTVLSIMRFEMSKLILKSIVGLICLTILILSTTLSLIKDLTVDIVSSWNKWNLLQSMFFIIELANLEFYIFPTFLGPSVADVITTIIVSSWFISRKVRNKLMHMLNGNVFKNKTGSITGNERTTRTNSSKNSKASLKTLQKTSNIPNLSNLNLESNRNLKSNSNINSTNLIRNVQFNDFDITNKNPVNFKKK